MGFDLQTLYSFAKKAQNKLKALGIPAEHIYIQDVGKRVNFIFISKFYDNFSYYDLAKISTLIHQGPLENRFYVIGERHLSFGTFGITVPDILVAKKVYGKKDLQVEDRSYLKKGTHVANTTVSGTIESSPIN